MPLMVSNSIVTGFGLRWAIHAFVAAAIFAVLYKYWLTTPVSHDSFVIWSNGWLAVRRNLGRVDSSERRVDFGLSRLREPSGILLARNPHADVGYHSRGVLLRLLCRASCKCPVTACNRAGSKSLTILGLHGV